MSRAFADITFTPSVKAAQVRYGSRADNAFFEEAEDPRNTLTKMDAEFIQARDSFYQATVSENGWPYVQHRGGPSGFLKVLDERTLGYADFSGNRQYLSVGNMAQDERVSIILMDYAQRRRLKIWGHARIIHEDEQPELIARLEVPTYRARIERGILIRVDAIEWNCPQHITPRFTEAEITTFTAPLIAENKALKHQLQELSSGTSKTFDSTALGTGTLALVITSVRQLTPKIRAYELRAADGGELPQVQAGAHIQLPVRLNTGELSLRHYSISSNPRRRDCYEIAVLHEPAGQGGSVFIHQHYQLGLQLLIEPPQNYFPLREQASHSVLIAAGIGITPIKAMAQTLKAQGASFEIHYAGASAQNMAYLDRLQRELGEQLRVYLSEDAQRINVTEVIQSAPSITDFYICGPQGLIQDFYSAASNLGLDPSRLHSENFSSLPVANENAVQLVLARSKKSISVSKDETLLNALEDAGIQVPFSCRTGNCGACAVQVLEGTPEHRDRILTDAQKQSGLMCVCISRAKSPVLKLNI